ncbi:unnamed protein product [Amoebophrya sp. A120]|nr:unnamed protein product [Amoebophrya sp. A120]|eukprot:GSA120T00021062001.1
MRSEKMPEPPGSPVPKAGTDRAASSCCKAKSRAPSPNVAEQYQKAARLLMKKKRDYKSTSSCSCQARAGISSCLRRLETARLSIGLSRSTRDHVLQIAMVAGDTARKAVAFHQPDWWTRWSSQRPCGAARPLLRKNTGESDESAVDLKQNATTHGSCRGAGKNRSTRLCVFIGEVVLCISSLVLETIVLVQGPGTELLSTTMNHSSRWWKKTTAVVAKLRRGRKPPATGPWSHFVAALRSRLVFLLVLLLLPTPLVLVFFDTTQFAFFEKQEQQMLQDFHMREQHWREQFLDLRVDEEEASTRRAHFVQHHEDNSNSSPDVPSSQLFSRTWRHSLAQGARQSAASALFANKPCTTRRIQGEEDGRSCIFDVPLKEEIVDLMQQRDLIYPQHIELLPLRALAQPREPKHPRSFGEGILYLSQKLAVLPAAAAVETASSTSTATKMMNKSHLIYDPRGRGRARSTIAALMKGSTIPANDLLRQVLVKMSQLDKNSSFRTTSSSTSGARHPAATSKKWSWSWSSPYLLRLFRRGRPRKLLLISNAQELPKVRLLVSQDPKVCRKQIVKLFENLYKNRPTEVYQQNKISMPDNKEKLEEIRKNAHRSAMHRVASGFYRELTFQEFKSAITRLEKEKSPGYDNTPHEIIKGLRGKGQELLYRLFYVILKHDSFPKIGNLAQLAPVQKTKDLPFCEMHYRPVSLLSVYSKLFEAIVDTRMNQWLEGYEWLGGKITHKTEPVLPRNSIAYRQGYSKEDSCVRLCDFLYAKMEQNLNDPKYVLLNDNIAGFDVVEHETLINTAKMENMPDDLLGVIISWLSGRTVKIREGSRVWVLRPGMPQGSPLSGGVFNLHHIPLIRYLMELNPNGIVTQYSDDNTQTGFLSMLSKMKSSLIDFGRKFFIFFEKDKSETIFYSQNYKDDPQEAGRSLGFLFDGTWTHNAMSDKILKDMTREANVCLGLKTLRTTKKVDVFESLCYSALSSTGSPQYPYFSSAAKLKIENTVSNKLKVLLGLPKRAPSTALYESTGLVRPHIMFLRECLMCFYKGLAKNLWEESGEELTQAEYGIINNNMVNPIAGEPIREKWTSIMRTISMERLKDIHEALVAAPLKIIRRCWRGVRMSVHTMDDVGRQWGYDSLTAISSEDEINRTRKRISWRQDREIRRKLQDAGHLVIATDGSASAGEGHYGGCGGATWWASDLNCDHVINEDFADWYPVEPICTSTAIVETPIKDAQVDSFDAETYALVHQTKKTTEHLRINNLSHLITKVSFYLDPNSVLEGLANMHEKSNIMFFHIMHALEELRDQCMKFRCKYKHEDPMMPAIAPENEIEFVFIWNAGHSGLFFNDLVDSIAGQALDRHERALEKGVTTQVYKKEITASILRRILTRRIRYWIGVAEFKPTSAPQLVERAREFGPFRPKAGTFPTRYLEQLYFYLFSGVVPSGILGAGMATHEDDDDDPDKKKYFQKCMLCEEVTEGHASHLVMDCRCPAALTARHLILGAATIPLTMENEKEIFAQPQKVFRFLHETNKGKKFLKNFACEQIKKNLHCIRPRMKADTKTKKQEENTYEKLGWQYKSIEKELLLDHEEDE